MKCHNGKGIFTAENQLSLRPVNNVASEEEEAERKELLELMAPGTLTHLELALIKPAVSIVGIKRLRSGQFGYSGHTITLAQDVVSIARDLPRTVADAGLITVSDLEDQDAASSNPNVRSTFRVRRRVVKRTLELLFKYHRYMNEMYVGGVGLNQANLDALHEDGVPINTDEFLHVDKRGRAKFGPGELAVTSNLVFRWLDAGEEDGVTYPIAAAAYAAWANNFNLEFEPDQDALIRHIQRTPAGRPMVEMVKIQDLMSYIAETEGSERIIPELRGLPSRRWSEGEEADDGTAGKKMSKKKRDAAEKQREKEERRVHEAWAPFDRRVIAELERYAEAAQYRDTRSMVPAGYRPKETEQEKEDAQIKKVLEGDEAGDAGGDGQLELKEAAASILIEFYCTLYILHVPYRDQRLIQGPFQARA